MLDVELRRPATTRRAAGMILPTSLALIAVVASAWAVRGMGQSLWRDEAATASASSRSLTQLVHLLGREDPGLAAYYLFMHAWTTVFGSSEVALRIPSLAAAAAAIVVIGVLAARMAGPVAGVAASLLLALVPDLVGTYAIQARPYALVLAFVCGAALCAFEVSRGRRSRWLLAAWSVLAAAAITFEVLAAPAVLPQLVWLLRAGSGGTPPRRAAALRRGLPALALPFVVGLAAVFMAYRGSALQSWIPPTSLHQIAVSAVGLVTPGGLLLVLASIPGLILVARLPRPPGARRLALTDLAVAVAWAILPFAVLAAFSLAVAPSFIPRYYLSATPGAALSLALVFAAAVRGLRSEPWRPASQHRLARLGVPLMALGATFAVALAATGGGLRVVTNEDLRGTAAVIRQEQLPGDGIVYAPTYSESGLRWYLGDSPASYRGPRDLLAMPGASALAAGSLWTPTRSGSTPVATTLEGVDRVWIAGYARYQPWTPVADVGTAVARAVEKCWTPSRTVPGRFSAQLFLRPTGTPDAGCRI